MARSATSPKHPSPALSPRRPELRQLDSLLRNKPLTLRDHYRAGELFRQLQDDPEVASLPGWRGEVAEALHISEATLNKCLQFRDRYAKGELAELERMRVGWGMLTVALAVPDKRQRHALLQRAVEEEWGGRCSGPSSGSREVAGAAAGAASRRGATDCCPTWPIWPA